MSKSHVEYEVVLYVGIAIHDPAFKGLPQRDRNYLRSIAELTDNSEIPQFRPILRHGEVIGYGIPIIIADRTDEFHEVDQVAFYSAVERARHTVAHIAQRVSPPFLPRLYSPQLLHAAPAGR